MIPAPAIRADDPKAMEAVGAQLARCAPQGAVIFLEGDLGAGKTTLARGFLRAAGHAGAVRSPTYTLVEPYDLPGGAVYHFDLYRLNDPEELEYLGIRDFFSNEARCLIEWPERGGNWLPAPDVRLRITMAGDGRQLELFANSVRGEAVVTCLTR